MLYGRIEFVDDRILPILSMTLSNGEIIIEGQGRAAEFATNYPCTIWIRSGEWRIYGLDSQLIVKGYSDRFLVGDFHLPSDTVSIRISLGVNSGITSQWRKAKKDGRLD